MIDPETIIRELAKVGNSLKAERDHLQEVNTDLLAALEDAARALKYAASHHTGDPLQGKIVATAQAARAAIAKARDE